MLPSGSMCLVFRPCLKGVQLGSKQGVLCIFSMILSNSLQCWAQHFALSQSWTPVVVLCFFQA